MKNKKICSIFVLLIYALSIAAYAVIALHPIFADAYSVNESDPAEVSDEVIEVHVEEPPEAVQIVDESEEPDITDMVSDSDVELLALVTLAEAEGESELGRRLVIDTVLNRVDNKQFPNTISEVIYQKNQFTSMHNGRCDRVKVNDETRALVREEFNNRTNTAVLYFTAGKYGKYGTRLFAEGHHYFCGE